MNEPLSLNKNDSKVNNALHAEIRLREDYNIQGKDRYIRLNAFNIDIRVCEYGEGKPILFVPGNTGDSFVFMPLIAQMHELKVLALNRPGGGLSEGFDHHSAPFKNLAIETLDAVLDSYGLDTVPIIAHSMGGHWSLWYAMERPARVEKLVLLGVPGNVLSCRPPLPIRLTSIPGLNRRLFSLVSSKSRSDSLRSLKMMGHLETTLASLPQSMAECYFHFQKLPHYEISGLSLMEAVNTLLGSRKEIHIEKKDLERVKQPVLMLWGGRDPFGSVKTGREIAQALSNSDFKLIPSGGHLPWLDEPEQCREMAFKFLDFAGR